MEEDGDALQIVPGVSEVKNQKFDKLVGSMLWRLRHCDDTPKDSERSMLCRGGEMRLSNRPINYVIACLLS